MEFVFETHYNARAMTVMAKALRKTVRKKHSRRSHRIGWLVLVLGTALVAANFALDVRTFVTGAAMLAIVTALLFEDRINGYVAKRHLLAGTEHCTTVFTEEGFVSTTALGRTEWNYDRIQVIAETADFFVLIYSDKHAQIYDKRQLQGGTPEEFRRFVEHAAGKQVQPVA